MMRVFLLAISALALGACAQSHKPETVALFGFNHESYGADGLYAVSDMAFAANRAGASGARIDAHADRAGDAAYNARLSGRRAGFTAHELIARGLPPEGVVTVAHGERDPAVATGDGVRARENRRVRIAPTGAGERAAPQTPWRARLPQARDQG